MDGFLRLQLPIHVRAIVTRLVVITPSVVICVIFPSKLNEMINIVNAILSFLLPFAFTPLVKYNCSEEIMGKFASKGKEKVVLYGFALAVWAINAVALSVPGGGFFGDIMPGLPWSWTKILLVILQVAIQVGYAWWNVSTLFSPVSLLPSP